MRNQVARPHQLAVLRQALDEHCAEAEIPSDSPLRNDVATRLMIYFNAGISGLDALKAALRTARFV